MNKVLVTGQASFLGYHVIKRLNEEHAIRPRVIAKGGVPAALLQGLDVEPAEGDVEDPDSLRAAFAGIDTVLHLQFLVPKKGITDERMRQVNVGGTHNVLQTAAATGVARVVLTSSVLAVGLNREPQPLDESADWAAHQFNFPYVLTRREAEQEARAMAGPGPDVVVVNPAFTMGPDDPVGAPANKLVKALINRKFPAKLNIGFGCLDVRDFAAGMLLAAERGRPGQRYILCGHNVTADDFFAEVAAIAGVKPPRWRLPRWAAYVLVVALETWNKLKGARPPVDRSLLQLFGGYAWYDARRAKDELGWEPRPLRTTLEETIAWVRENPAAWSPEQPSG